jgi:succinyl-CoA synthetase beta subunit
MDLLEYQGKQLFARHGVPVPAGAPAGTVKQAVAAADEIGYPCVIKAQVLIGGRGKAGGIKVAQLGFQDFHARRLAFEAGVDADVVRPVGALLTKLYDAFSGTKGTAAAKAEALEAKGVRAGRTPTEVAEIAAEIAGSLAR